jgi:predicted nucleic acid-binding protein
MSLVVDSSVIVAALLSTDDVGAWAARVIEDGSIFAPELIRVEVTNIIRRLERAKEMTEQEADAAYADFMELDLYLHPFEPFADRIWELRHNVTSYDAWYVALAEALDLPLATLDIRLAVAKGPSCRFVTPPESKLVQDREY